MVIRGFELTNLLRSRVIYVVIAALTLACHWSGLDTPWLIYDDAEVVQPEVWTGWEDPAGLVRIWTHDNPFNPHYRPVADSVLWLGQQLWGEREIGFRLLNLALHLSAVFWSIALFRRIGIPHPELVGFFVALHPLAVQPVMRLVESRVLLADLLFVGALWSLVRQHLEQSWRWGVLGLVLFMLALLSKSTAVSFAPTLLVLVLLFRIRPSRQTWLVIGASFALTIAFGLLDWQLTVAAEGFRSPPDRAMLTIVSVLQYLRNLLIPYPLAWLYDPRVEPLEWVCGGIVVAALVGLCATKRWQQLRVLVLVLTLFLVSIAPAMVGHVTWGLSPAQDRYQHLSTFVLVPYLAFVLASVMSRGPLARRIGVAVVTALCVLVVVTTFRVAWTYGTADRFFTAAERTAPDNPHAPLFWADNLEREGRFKAAMWVLTKKVDLLRDAGNSDRAKLMLAWLYLQSRECEKAFQLLPYPRSLWGSLLVTAISLECPNIRRREGGHETIINLSVRLLVEEVVTLGQERPVEEQFRRPQIDTLLASAAADAGRFDEAERLITRALAHPSLHGRGKFRARLRDHLLDRQRVYRSGLVYRAPESQVLWRSPPWVR